MLQTKEIPCNSFFFRPKLTAIIWIYSSCFFGLNNQVVNMINVGCTMLGYSLVLIIKSSEIFRFHAVYKQIMSMNYKVVPNKVFISFIFVCKYVIIIYQCANILIFLACKYFIHHKSRGVRTCGRLSDGPPLTSHHIEAVWSAWHWHCSHVMSWDSGTGCKAEYFRYSKKCLYLQKRPFRVFTNNGQFML